MPTVGVLTVDLVANTAEFTGDLGKAADSAEEFGKSAANAGGAMDFSMREARGSMMLLGEELGVRVPRELRTLIAEIPGVGAAFAAIIPIIGAVFAVGLIYKAIEAHRKAAEELARAWEAVGTDGVNAMVALDTKLLEVQKVTDELSGDHVRVLRDQLALVDRATLADVEKQFEELGKKADEAFTKMHVGWFQNYILQQGNNAGIDNVRERFDNLIKTVQDYKAAGNDKGIATVLEEERTKVQGILDTFQKWGTGSKEILDANQKELAVLDQMAARYAKINEVAAGEKKNDTTRAAQQEAAEQYQIYEAQQRGLEQRRRAEAEYTKEVARLHKEAIKEQERLEEEQAAATASVLSRDAKIRECLAKEETNQDLAMSKLRIAAADQEARFKLAIHQGTARQIMATEIKTAEDEAHAEVTSLNRQIADLDKFSENYLVKLKELEDKKTQIITKSENDVIKIREQAEQKQLQDVRRAEEQMTDAIAKDIAKTIVENKNLAQAFKQTSEQMLETALTNIIKMAVLGEQEKLDNARKAYGGTYAAISQIPYVGPFLAPPMAAAAAAAVMGFEGGGEVPGTGYGDSVPAMLTPGETVVTKTLTEQVKNSGGGARAAIHIHMPPIQALDAEGVDRVMQKHAARISKNVSSHLRKQYKRG